MGCLSASIRRKYSGETNYFDEMSNVNMGALTKIPMLLKLQMITPRVSSEYNGK